MSLTPEAQHERLTERTEEALPEGALLERLRLCARERRPLRVKQGFDPTAPDIHLGHTVGLRKLREFQELGHQVVLIVGDYTGMVGDPSGRSKTRPQLTEAEVEAHAKTYLEQFYRVLDQAPAPPRLPVEVHRNGEWFSRMTFMEVMRLASNYTIARMLERDDFAKRWAAQQPISMHELFYPLMQGYDSVAIRADVELGGTEQKFNLLVGRVLQEQHGQRPQIAMTMPILPGLDGVQRMSKSLGNYVGVTDPPHEMFGKIMSLPDETMMAFWKLVTDASSTEIHAIEQALRAGENPMNAKKQLGHRIVRMYHGETAAGQAQAQFETQFSRREIPEDLPVLRLAVQGAGIKDILVAAGFTDSGSAAWRAVDQGAVRVDGEKVTDRSFRWTGSQSFVLKMGRRMARIEPTGPASVVPGTRGGGS